jgi:hypothetical protein
MVYGGACSYKMQGRIHYGMCHAKHCTQHTVLHFALQRSKKQDELPTSQGLQPSSGSRRTMADKTSRPFSRILPECNSQPRVRGVQFPIGAVLQHSNTPILQYSNTPRGRIRGRERSGPRTATPLNSLRARILATAAPDLGHRIHEQSWSRLKNGPASLGADYGYRGSTLSGFRLMAESQK